MRFRSLSTRLDPAQYKCFILPYLALDAIKLPTYYSWLTEAVLINHANDAYFFFFFFFSYIQLILASYSFKTFLVALLAIFY